MQLGVSPLLTLVNRQALKFPIFLQLFARDTYRPSFPSTTFG